MKFLFLNAAIAATIMPSVRVMADDRHVSPLHSTRLFPDADFRVVVDPAASSDASNNRQYHEDGRVYGKALVFPAFIRKMQQVTGKIVNSLKGSSFHDVQTLYLTESSPRHTDVRIKGMVPVDREDSDGSLIAFYVHEATDNAYFQTDDDELCIPFVEGSAVYFNGGLPHNSIVKSGGVVKLVGPFLLSSLESVGSPTKTAKRPKGARRLQLSDDDEPINFPEPPIRADPYHRMLDDYYTPPTKAAKKTKSEPYYYDD